MFNLVLKTKALLDSSVKMTGLLYQVTDREAFFIIKLMFCVDTLIIKIYVSKMKINVYWTDLTDISAQDASLVTDCSSTVVVTAAC